MSVTDQSSYQFIDSGDFERLEKFGPYYVVRSCPTATWKRNLNIPEWEAVNRLEYQGTSGKVGSWYGVDKLSPEANWTTTFDNSLNFTLSPGPYGQIGVFPEQQASWKFIKQSCIDHVNAIKAKYPEPEQIKERYRKLCTSYDRASSNDKGAQTLPVPLTASESNRPTPLMRVMNGFAYTGIHMSLAYFYVSYLIVYDMYICVFRRIDVGRSASRRSRGKPTSIYIPSSIFFNS